jgi:hypothetical protein
VGFKNQPFNAQARFGRFSESEIARNFFCAVEFFWRGADMIVRRRFATPSANGWLRGDGRSSAEADIERRQAAQRTDAHDPIQTKGLSDKRADVLAAWAVRPAQVMHRSDLLSGSNGRRCSGIEIECGEAGRKTAHTLRGCGRTPRRISVPRIRGPSDAPNWASVAGPIFD